jgi:Kef-type K+ transport system membrane component KefB
MDIGAPEILLLVAIFGALTAWLFQRAGRSPALGLVVGIFLGPLGLLAGDYMSAAANRSSR